jgi:hypothetical protein
LNVVRWVVLSSLCAAPFAWAQDGGVSDVAAGAVEAPLPSPPPAPPPIEAAPPPAAVPPAVAPGSTPAPREVVSDRSIGIHVGLNLGLFAFDVHQGHVYAFVAANAGVPLVSNGSVGAFALGMGYSTALSRPDESMWFMDFFVDALPGWVRTSGLNTPDLVVGVGGGLGFRYLHRSGFTLGFKVPVFGASFTTQPNVDTAQSVGSFYLFNLIALPIISFGYRF